MSLVLVCNHTNFASAKKKAGNGVPDGHNVEVDAHINL